MQILQIPYKSILQTSQYDSKYLSLKSCLISCEYENSILSRVAFHLPNFCLIGFYLDKILPQSNNNNNNNNKNIHKQTEHY